MNDTLKMMIEQAINEYVEKYANKHHVSKEEAQKHALVKLMNNYYTKNGGHDH